MKNKETIYKITSIVLLLDQVIKLLIGKSMALYERITIIPKFFSIYFVKNTGAAFSILEDNTILLIIISVIFIIVLNEYIKREQNISKLSKISLGMILGGIFGNLLDRIIHHAVLDYLSFNIINYEFPVFNLADINITVGMCLFLLDMLLEKKRKE